jgi:hypothetical protein
MHNPLNKPLRSGPFLHNLENKGDNLQDIQNAGVMVSLEPLERHKPEAGGFCLDLTLNPKRGRALGM